MLTYKKNDTVYLEQGNTMGRTENMLLKVTNVINDNQVFTECITNKAYGQKHTRIGKDFLKGMQYTFSSISPLIPCSMKIFNETKFEIFIGSGENYPKKYDEITGTMQVKAQKRFSWQGVDFFVYKDSIFEYLTGLYCGPFVKSMVYDNYYLNTLVERFEKLCNMCTYTEKEITDCVNIESKRGKLLNKTNEGNKKVTYTEKATVCGFNFVLIKSPKHGYYVVIEQYTGVAAHTGSNYENKDQVWNDAIKKIRYNKNKIPAILSQFEKINS